MTNKLTLSQVEQIIDNHLESETNFMFVCDFSLAHYIYDYLYNDYGIKAESLELSSEIEEYYFSVTFYKDGEICLICENAKCLNGEYKFDDNFNWVDYFVFTDMDKDLVNEKLEGKGSKCWCELVDEEENEEYMDEDDECVDCECEECRKDRFFQLLTNTLNCILETEGCPDCIMQSLLDYTMEFQDLGFMLAKK